MGLFIYRTSLKTCSSLLKSISFGFYENSKKNEIVEGLSVKSLNPIEERKRCIFSSKELLMYVFFRRRKMKENSWESEEFFERKRYFPLKDPSTPIFSIIKRNIFSILEISIFYLQTLISL